MMIWLENHMTTIRRVTFVTTILSSLIALSLSAALASLTGGGAVSFGFSSFPLAASVITLLLVGPMFFVDLYRKGSYFSYVVVEVSCLSFLWLLWLSSAADTANKDHAISLIFSGQSGCHWSSALTSPYSPNSVYPPGYPSTNYGLPKLDQACREIKAIEAVSFLTWLLLMSYTVTLLALALRARSRGHNVWQTAVSDGVIFYPNEKGVGGAPQAVAQQPAVYQSYPPSAQQSPHPLAQQYISSPAQQYISPPAQQQYISSPAQQYVSPPAQQYNPGGSPPLAQQYLPTSVSHAYPAQA
jgi:hypothetical protein